LVDEEVETHSHGALNIYEYKGEESLVVINAKSIISVVAMVPFKQEGEVRRFFLIEKFALGVVDSASNVGLE